MKILVTGAAGYIGSVVTECLIQDGHNVVGLDDLRYGHRMAVHPDAEFVEVDIVDATKVEQVFEAYPIDAVVHLAAEAFIDLSTKDPGRFFSVNVTGGIHLLESMRTRGIDRMVFSSTAAVYGEPKSIPITESAEKEPVNAYGESKLQFERIMAWYRRSFGLKHVSLRYFNACGATNRCGEARKHETHIMPILFEVVQGKRERFSLFGGDYDTPDGTCVRDYIHVVDIARAHILSLEKIDELGARAYNLGNGTGYSNLQVLKAVEEATGAKIDYQITDRREGDPATLVASSDLIRQELGWNPQFPDLRGMVESAWEWRKSHPEGYTR